MAPSEVVLREQCREQRLASHAGLARPADGGRDAARTRLVKRLPKADLDLVERSAVSGHRLTERYAFTSGQYVEDGVSRQPAISGSSGPEKSSCPNGS